MYSFQMKDSVGEKRGKNCRETQSCPEVTALLLEKAKGIQMPSYLKRMGNSDPV
jgi:hypothetical protein